MWYFQDCWFTFGTGITLSCTPIFPVCIHCKTKQNPWKSNKEWPWKSAAVLEYLNPFRTVPKPFKISSHENWARLKCASPTDWLMHPSIYPSIHASSHPPISHPGPICVCAGSHKGLKSPCLYSFLVAAIFSALLYSGWSLWSILSISFISSTSKLLPLHPCSWSSFNHFTSLNPIPLLIHPWKSFQPIRYGVSQSHPSINQCVFSRVKSSFS